MVRMCLSGFICCHQHRHSTACKILGSIERVSSQLDRRACRISSRLTQMDNSLLVHFGDPDSSNQHASAWAITTVLFKASQMNHEGFPAPPFCHSCRMMIKASSFAGRIVPFGYTDCARRLCLAWKS
jgi:hypothetical protein